MWQLNWEKGCAYRKGIFYGFSPPINSEFSQVLVFDVFSYESRFYIESADSPGGFTSVCGDKEGGKVVFVVVCSYKGSSIFNLGDGCCGSSRSLFGDDML